MNFIIFLISNLFLFLFLNYLFNKFNIFQDNFNVSFHKQFINKQRVPYSGGIVLYITLILYGFYENNINYLLTFVLLSIGLLSDTHKLNSTLKRFLFQLIIIIIFIYVNDLYIPSIKLSYFDTLIQNNVFFSILFTSLCFLILLNGSNFIDGVNIQCSGYFLSVIICLYLSQQNAFSIENYTQLFLLLLYLITFICFNILNKSYLGDNGSYLLSFLMGVILVRYAIENPISPYFIALLLWYPAFENFFSILRRGFFDRTSIDSPDNLHLHHLMYKFLNKKFNNNYVKKNATGLIINLFNFLVFLLGKNYIYSSPIQVILILFSIIIYLITYRSLKKKLSND